MADYQADLLHPLEPAPPSEEPLPGTLRGSTEGLGAGLAVWCGPALGWRPLGDMTGAAGCLVRNGRRLTVALAFEVGEV